MGAPRKSGGTVKIFLSEFCDPTFEMFPAPLTTIQHFRLTLILLRLWHHTSHLLTYLLTYYLTVYS